jgi:hypothetical protein
VKAVKQFGAMHDYNMTLSGGGEKATFRISAGYKHQTGSIIKQKFQQFTTRLVLDYNVSDRIRFSTNFALTYTNNDKNYSNLLGIAQNMAPNMSIYRQDANGNDTGEYYIMNESNPTTGGGATDIRLVNGNWDSFNSLKTRIIVAAGGGGGSIYQKGSCPTYGGHAGGLVAPNNYSRLREDVFIAGATQTSAKTTSLMYLTWFLSGRRIISCIVIFSSIINIMVFIFNILLLNPPILSIFIEYYLKCYFTVFFIMHIICRIIKLSFECERSFSCISDIDLIV